MSITKTVSLPDRFIGDVEKCRKEGISLSSLLQSAILQRLKFDDVNSVGSAGSVSVEVAKEPIDVRIGRCLKYFEWGFRNIDANYFLRCVKEENPRDSGFLLRKCVELRKTTKHLDPSITPLDLLNYFKSHANTLRIE